MLQRLIPMLLMAAVALSANHIIPVLATNELDGAYSQTNDNTLRNRQNARYIFNRLFCKDNTDVLKQGDIPKPCRYYYYFDGDNNKADSYENVEIDKADNYNGEGHRKEQWHNYPRQLDRLQNFPYDRHKPFDVKRGFEPGDPNDELVPENAYNKLTTANEYVVTSDDAIGNVYDTRLTSTSPLFILKIRLASLNAIKDTEDLKTQHDRETENLITNDINPDVLLQKFKRNNDINQEYTNFSEQNEEEKFEPLPVNKRLFSLWSRLQSLSHKGHDLPHRRHLHAYYGLQEGFRHDGGLTAETRAAMIRPPGSPLRWG